MIELADVLRRHWPAYVQRQAVLPSQVRAVSAILACRTPRLGGQLYRCDCAGFQYSYHSCNHRACPKCGHAQATHWIDLQKGRLLPVPYFLVTFTVPEQLRALFFAHQKRLYSLFFAQSAATLQDIAADPKHLGGELGLVGVLHTWTRQLGYHPHIHFLVAGGGLSSDGLRWIRVGDYLLPQKVLARRFRNRLRVALQQKDSPHLDGAVWRKEWVVDIVKVGSGETALKYLANYVYKTALGSQRIVSDDGRQIRFTFRDSVDRRRKTATVSAMEFIRRWARHILPRGFQRVRYFGWMSPAARKRRERIDALLDWKRPAPPVRKPIGPPECPHCHKPMRCVGQLPRAPP